MSTNWCKKQRLTRCVYYPCNIAVCLVWVNLLPESHCFVVVPLSLRSPNLDSRNCGHDVLEVAFRISHYVMFWKRPPSLSHKMWTVFYEPRSCIIAGLLNLGYSVHVTLELHLPIWRDTFKVSNKRELYLYSIYFQIFIHTSVNVIFKKHYILIVKYINFEDIKWSLPLWL